IALLSTATLVGIGINSLLENKNIADDSILNDNLSNNVVSDYPATTGFISMANQFRHSVETNQGWIGISQDSKTLLYTTFDGVRRWTKDMQSTIYDAKFNQAENTLTVLSHSPDPTNNNFFMITLLDIKGNTLSVYRDSLSVSWNGLDPRATSPYSLKIIMKGAELWTMVSVNPLAYLAPMEVYNPTSSKPGLNLYLSSKNVHTGEWTTDINSTLPAAVNRTIANWISRLRNDIVSVGGDSYNTKIVSDFQLFINQTGSVGISTVTRYTPTGASPDLTGSLLYHSLNDIISSTSRVSIIKDMDSIQTSKAFSVKENATYRKGIAGIGYSRHFPEKNNQLLIPIRTTFADFRAPVVVVARQSNGIIGFPVSFHDALFDLTFLDNKELFRPFDLWINSSNTSNGKQIFSELALGIFANSSAPRQISYDDIGLVTPGNTSIIFHNPTYGMSDKRILNVNLTGNSYDTQKMPILSIPSLSSTQPVGVGAMVYFRDPNSNLISTQWEGSGGKVVSYGDYQKLADADPGLLYKTVEEITPNDLSVLSKSNQPDYGFGLTNITSEKSKIITIESRDTNNQTLNMKIVWRHKLYHTSAQSFFFEYSENVTISGFSKIDTPIYATRAYNVFQINSISGNTKDIDIAVEQRSGQPHYAKLFELRFGFKTSNGTIIDLGSGGKSGFYTAEGIKTISAAGQGSRITKFSDMNLYVKMVAKTTATEEIWTYDRQEYLLLNHATSLVDSTVPPQTDIDNSLLTFNSTLFRRSMIDDVNEIYKLEYFVNVSNDWDITWGFKSKVVMENIILEVTENVVDLANNKGIFLYFMDKNGSRVRITSNQTIITP
ncbi:MAG: hypothetical protein KFW07_03340, partial [Mycoplasmataceae bacterium]|nr:hypothetical protein [Mycoplasmataceae bacterium]